MMIPPKFGWESIRTYIDIPEVPGPRILRARVPGGWLILAHEAGAIRARGATFYHDPGHQWDGTAQIPVKAKPTALESLMEAQWRRPSDAESKKKSGPLGGPQH